MIEQLVHSLRALASSSAERGGHATIDTARLDEIAQAYSDALLLRSARRILLSRIPISKLFAGGTSSIA